MKAPRHPDGKTPKIPMQACPRCGYEMNAASPTLLKNRAPKAGHLTICLNCGHAMQFSDGMLMIEVTPAVWAEIRKRQPDLIQQIAMLQVQIHARGDIRRGRG